MAGMSDATRLSVTSLSEREREHLEHITDTWRRITSGDAGESRVYKNRVWWIDGARGSGKSSLMQTLIHPWRAQGACPKEKDKRDADTWCPGDPALLTRVLVLPDLDTHPLPENFPLFGWLMQAFSERAEELDKLQPASTTRQRDCLSEDYALPPRSLSEQLWQVQAGAILGWAANPQARDKVEWTHTHGDQLRAWFNLEKEWKKFLDEFLKAQARACGLKPECILVVLPLDDLDLQVDGARELLHALQRMRHPQLGVVVAGDREHLRQMVQLTYARELSRGLAGEEQVRRWLGEDPVSGTRGVQELARAITDKGVPKASTYEMEALLLSKLLEEHPSDQLDADKAPEGDLAARLRWGLVNMVTLDDSQDRSALDLLRFASQTEPVSLRWRPLQQLVDQLTRNKLDATALLDAWIYALHREEHWAPAGRRRRAGVIALEQQLREAWVFTAKEQSGLVRGSTQRWRWREELSEDASRGDLRNGAGALDGVLALELSRSPRDTNVILEGSGGDVGFITQVWIEQGRRRQVPWFGVHVDRPSRLGAFQEAVLGYPLHKPLESARQWILLNLRIGAAESDRLLEETVFTQATEDPTEPRPSATATMDQLDETCGGLDQCSWEHIGDALEQLGHQRLSPDLTQWLTRELPLLAMPESGLAPADQAKVLYLVLRGAGPLLLDVWASEEHAQERLTALAASQHWERSAFAREELSPWLIYGNYTGRARRYGATAVTKDGRLSVKARGHAWWLHPRTADPLLALVQSPGATATAIQGYHDPTISSRGSGSRRAIDWFICAFNDQQEHPHFVTHVFSRYLAPWLSTGRLESLLSWEARPLGTLSALFFLVSPERTGASVLLHKLWMWGVEQGVVGESEVVWRDEQPTNAPKLASRDNHLAPTKVSDSLSYHWERAWLDESTHHVGKERPTEEPAGAGQNDSDLAHVLRGLVQTYLVDTTVSTAEGEPLLTRQPERLRWKNKPVPMPPLRSWLDLVYLDEALWRGSQDSTARQRQGLLDERTEESWAFLHFILASLTLLGAKNKPTDPRVNAAHLMHGTDLLSFPPIDREVRGLRERLKAVEDSALGEEARQWALMMRDLGTEVLSDSHRPHWSGSILATQHEALLHLLNDGKEDEIGKINGIGPVGLKDIMAMRPFESVKAAEGHLRTGTWKALRAHVVSETP
ncbi:MAG: hypothetical protein JXX28_15330 [Deltaproteobacteria bacterium]|nr:hypothetical protein [Deltaproteobacteria bacterium]